MERYKSQIPQMSQVAPVAPQMFESLAQRLSAFSAKEEDRLDKLMAKKAREKGFIDQQGKNTITLKTGETIADQSWNAGAETAYLSEAKRDLTENLARIQSEASADPDLFINNSRAMVSGMTKGLPPKIAALVQDEAAGMMAAGKAEIISSIATLDREKQAADTLTAIDLYMAEAQQLALNGDVEGATDKENAAGVLIQGGVDAGLFEASTGEKKRREIKRGTETELLNGEFIKAMNNGFGIEALERMRSKKKLGDWTPEDKRKLEDSWVSLMKKQHQAIDDELDHEKKVREERQRQHEVIAANKALRGELDAKWLDINTENENLDPAVALKHHRQAAEGGRLYSDGHALLAYKMFPHEFNATDIATDSRLTFTDRGNVHKEWTDTIEDASNWKRTQRGKESIDRIGREFDILNMGDVAFLSDAERRIVGTLMTELYNRVEREPLEHREQRSLEIADELIAEIKNDNKQKEIAQHKANMDIFIDGISPTTDPTYTFTSMEAIENSDLPVELKASFKKERQDREDKLKRLEADLAK